MVLTPDSGFDFFGAPLAGILSMHRDLGPADALSVSMYLQTLILALTARGLSTCVEAGSTIARASSGSRSAISSVEPLMSANNAVTVLRSPAGGEAPDCSSAMRKVDGASGADDLALASTEPMPMLRALPQSAQNFAPGALSELQFEQRFDSGLPHSAQNFLPGIPSVPHFEQRILMSPTLVDQRLGVLEIGAASLQRDNSVIQCCSAFSPGKPRRFPRAAC